MGQLNFVTVLFLLCLSFWTQVQSQVLGNFGDSCTRHNPCDDEQNLICLGGHCRCSQPEEMVYDVDRERCAIREGQECHVPRHDYGDNNPCVTNAHCSQDKVCTCSSYAYPDKRGRCFPKKHHNDTCSYDGECDDKKYLSCVDGHCACERLGSYDEYHQVCKRRAQEICKRSRDCVKHAECVEGTCVCRKNYIEMSNKLCGLGYGQSCSGNGLENPCSDVFFACINGICQCKNPSYEIYDRESRTCLSLVGGLCHLYMGNTAQPVKLKNCVANAECIRRDYSALSQCECVKGFSETISGKCQLAYGASCEGSPIPCDEGPPLFCRNGKCDCQNEFDMYDPEDKLCRRMIGSICDSAVNLCIKNAICDSGRCKCVSGHQPNFRGACEKDRMISSPSEIFENTIFPPEYNHRK